MHEHGQRADAIVRGMMEHARLGADGPGQPRRPVDFNDLVEEQVASTFGNYRRKDRAALRLFRDYGDRVGTVMAVPQELARVVQGLLANALDAVEERAAREQKAAPENGRRRAATYEPTITVRTRRDGDTVTLIVSDNGPGIPEPLRHRIFEPFFTTKPTGSGHPGLGLSLAHETVVMGYGGRLDVDSTPGVVTTFTLTVPTA